MRQPTSKPIRHSYPGMVALVTARWRGEQNIMAAGWHSFISIDPPIYGVAVGLERFTYHLVKESRVFGVNFLAADRSEIIQAVGVTSGRDVDKFAAYGLAYTEGLTVDVPILSEAYVAYECSVIDARTYGDHDWFVATLNMSYRDNELFLDNGLPNLQKLEIPLYMGRSDYAILDAKARRNTHIMLDT